MRGHLALHGVGQKFRNDDIASEAVDFQSFHKRAVTQGKIVIEKVPVFAKSEADVGTKGDEAAARPKDSGCFLQAVRQILLGGQVFEKIAGEDDVYRTRAQPPTAA